MFFKRMVELFLSGLLLALFALALWSALPSWDEVKREGYALVDRVHQDTRTLAWGRSEEGRRFRMAARAREAKTRQAVRQQNARKRSQSAMRDYKDVIADATALEISSFFKPNPLAEQAEAKLRSQRWAVVMNDLWPVGEDLSIEGPLPPEGIGPLRSPTEEELDTLRRMEAAQPQPRHPAPTPLLEEHSGWWVDIDFENIVPYIREDEWPNLQMTYHLERNDKDALHYRVEWASGLFRLATLERDSHMRFRLRGAMDEGGVVRIVYVQESEDRPQTLYATDEAITAPSAGEDGQLHFGPHDFILDQPGPGYLVLVIPEAENLSLDFDAINLKYADSLQRVDFDFFAASRKD